MEFFDSHAHLDDERFDGDREEIIGKIRMSGVTRLISAGYSLEGSKKAVELSKKYDFIYATCGISPNDIPQTEEELWKMLDEIERLAKENDKVFRTLLIDSADPKFKSRFMQRSIIKFIENLNITFLTNVEQYIFSYILNGSTGIILQWVRSDYKTSENVICELLFSINKSALTNLKEFMGMAR